MTTVRPAPYSRRVSRGARLLDLRYPGWWTHVDSRRLDTSSVRDCVLGHLVRAQVVRPIPPGDTFGDALAAVGLTTGNYVSYGFDAAETTHYVRNCAILDKFWRQEINRRASHQDRRFRTAGA